MSITQVNGFQCKNCTDIDYAKKHIDPARPKDGPYGVNAKNDPSRPVVARDDAVSFGGRLKDLGFDPTSSQGAASIARPSGQRLNLSV